MLDATPSTSLVGAYLFGDFRLDPARRLLYRQSHVVSLPERVFEILLMLLEANGAVVKREAIASRVWPEAIVADGNIAQHIYLLRQILGEHARDRAVLMTVSKRGYRLTTPVMVESQESSLADSLAHNVPQESALGSFRDYCHGSYLLERKSASELRRALGAFESVLNADRNYLPALVGLARAYVVLAELGLVPAPKALRKAKDLVGRALALSPSSAEARAVLSGLLILADWDWRAAKFELDTGLRLDPNSPVVRYQAVYYHICAGEHDRAVYEAQRNLMIEPSSLSRQLLFGLALMHAGRHQHAITCMSKLIDSDETFHVARRYRAQALLLSERPEDALADLLAVPQCISEDRCFRLPLLGRAYADCGEKERAEQLYSNLQSIATAEYVSSWNLAIVAVAIGRCEAALAHLERAVVEREPALLFLKSLPWFAQIADQPRFKAISLSLGPSGIDDLLTRGSLLCEL